jgi:hypothetical protein
LKHRGTEAQRIPEGEIEGGQREEREDGKRERRMGMDGDGDKKSTLRWEGCFYSF